MDNLLAVFAFLIIPLSSIGLLFLKDLKPERRQNLNILLILNALLFLFPLFLSYINTPRGAKFFDAFSSGPGAEFVWWYVFIFPLCGAFQIALIVLKIVNASEYSMSKPKGGQTKD